MKHRARLRLSVVGLFVDGNEVLLIHQMTPPEPDCWDLPGGGIEPHETLLDGLRREITEETGLQAFHIDGLLTAIEDFFPEMDDKLLHTVNLVYRCRVDGREAPLHSRDPEIGPKGIQWLPVAHLTPAQCSRRSWQALQAAGLV